MSRIQKEVEAIVDVVKSAWRRLTHKQLLAAYPFALGIINVLAFLAVYSAAQSELSLDHFARANFERWPFIQEHLADFFSSGTMLLVGLVAAVCVCFLAAAIRAPFFRAVVGYGYPLAPRSFLEFIRLAFYYAITYSLFYVVPYCLPADSAIFTVVAIALLPVSLLLMFGDYALVFEGIGPWAAIKRSISLFRKAWVPAVSIYALGLLVWSIVTALYGRYYEGGAQIFALLPISQLLVEALITTLLDVLLISTYERYRG